jgi:hypothetical protein
LGRKKFCLKYFTQKSFSPRGPPGPSVNVPIWGKTLFASHVSGPMANYKGRFFHAQSGRKKSPFCSSPKMVPLKSHPYVGLATFGGTPAGSISPTPPRRYSLGIAVLDVPSLQGPGVVPLVVPPTIPTMGALTRLWKDGFPCVSRDCPLRKNVLQTLGEKVFDRVSPQVLSKKFFLYCCGLRGPESVPFPGTLFREGWKLSSDTFNQPEELRPSGDTCSVMRTCTPETLPPPDLETSSSQESL